MENKIKKALKEHLEYLLPNEIQDDLEIYQIAKHFEINGIDIYCEGSISYFFETDPERNDTPASTLRGDVCECNIVANYINELDDLVEIEIDEL